MSSKLILVGMKSSGKTSVGRELSRLLGLEFVDVDQKLEARYFEETGIFLSCRDILAQLGTDYYRKLESKVLQTLSKELSNVKFVLATGGGAVLDDKNREILSGMGLVVFLDVEQGVLLSRIVAGGIPPFFLFPEDPEQSLSIILNIRKPLYTEMSDVIIRCDSEAPALIADRIVAKVRTYNKEGIL